MWLISQIEFCFGGKIAAWQAVEREGKGQNNLGRIGRSGVGNGLQGRYCFLGVIHVRPPDESKNCDWSDLMNYPIRCSNWSATCHSRASGFVYTDAVSNRNGFMTWKPH